MFVHVHGVGPPDVIVILIGRASCPVHHGGGRVVVRAHVVRRWRWASRPTEVSWGWPSVIKAYWWRATEGWRRSSGTREVEWRWWGPTKPWWHDVTLSFKGARRRSFHELARGWPSGCHVLRRHIAIEYLGRWTPGAHGRGEWWWRTPWNHHSLRWGTSCGIKRWLLRTSPLVGKRWESITLHRGRALHGWPYLHWWWTTHCRRRALHGRRTMHWWHHLHGRWSLHWWHAVHWRGSDWGLEGYGWWNIQRASAIV